MPWTIWEGYTHPAEGETRTRVTMDPAYALEVETFAEDGEWWLTGNRVVIMQAYEHTIRVLIERRAAAPRGSFP